jgi:MFS family permease
MGPCSRSVRYEANRHFNVAHLAVLDVDWARVSTLQRLSTSIFVLERRGTLVNFSGIWGPVLAGWMCGTRLGRKYTMVVGALVTMAFFFAYTQVRTATQNVSIDATRRSVGADKDMQVAFTCIVNFCLNIYYGTLYAYTPEVLPSAHRGTGNGIAIGWNRIMGILSAVIATVAGVSYNVARIEILWLIGC